MTQLLRKEDVGSGSRSPASASNSAISSATASLDRRQQRARGMIDKPAGTWESGAKTDR
jgi:hypothetical protein